MQVSLGEVKPSSTTTALRATNNTPSFTSPQPLAQAVTDRFVCEAIQFQALETNTGGVYICDRETPTLTTHVHVRIPKPSAGPPESEPAWTVGNPTGSNPINANEYWILPAVAGEGVRITALVT